MECHLLVLIELTPHNRARFEATGFRVHVALTPAERAAKIVELGGAIRAVLTNGSTGLRADEIATLTRLEIICALGAGYENIDLAAACARGIVVTNGAGTNDASVADHAMALLMSVVRGIPQADFAVRRGGWAGLRQMRPMLFGKKLGILGLGNIGNQIARRAHQGFDMQVAYHNRKPRGDSAYLYFATPSALADWSDFLIVAMQALVTGALHEDGLGDTADGLGGGRDREAALTIMKDSRIGTYAAVALILSFGLRVSALAAFLPLLSPLGGASALLGTAALSRMAMVWHWSRLLPARRDGVAAAAGIPEPRATSQALGSGAILALLLFYAAGIPPIAAPLAFAAFAVTVLGFGRIVSRKLGGHTGDTIGATQQLTEIAVLGALALAV